MVCPAVVVPFELEHEVAARRGAHEAHGRLRRLRAGGGVAQLLDAGNERGDQLANLAGEPVREGEVDTGARHRLLHRLPHEVGVMAEEVDAVAAAVVEVLVAVDVADA